MIARGGLGQGILFSVRYARPLTLAVKGLPLNTSAVRSGFYRPELDLLRLLAFLLVFALHGPRLTEAGANVPHWKALFAYAFNRFALAGQAGLPLFFFLSS